MKEKLIVFRVFGLYWIVAAWPSGCDLHIEFLFSVVIILEELCLDYVHVYVKEIHT